MLAIEVKTNTKTKSTQKFLSNLTKKTWNFVNFVNFKQKTETHLNSNQNT